MLTPPKNKILVLSKLNYYDVDRIIATIVLGRYLGERYESDVDVLFNKPVPLGPIENMVAINSVNVVEQLTPRFYSVSLHKGESQITDVKWEAVGDKLELKIYTNNGILDVQDLEQGAGRPDYDFIYLLGLPARKDAETMLGQFAPLLDSAEVMAIDLRNNNEFGSNTHVAPDAKTYAELVLSFLEKLAIPLSAEAATELLTAVYWKTNALRNRYAGPQSFQTVQKLLSYQASLSRAVTNVFATMSLIEVRTMQEIYHNLQITKEKIALTKVSKETARQLTKVLPVYPNKNPLFTLKDIRASFVLIPVADQRTLVLTSNPDRDINLKRMFSDQNFVGDSLQGELVFENDLETTETAISSALSLSAEPGAAATPVASSSPQTPARPQQPDNRSTGNNPGGNGNGNENRRNRSRNDRNRRGKINMPQQPAPTQLQSPSQPQPQQRSEPYPEPVFSDYAPEIQYIEADPLPPATGQVELSAPEEPAPAATPQMGALGNFMPPAEDPLPRANDQF